MTDRLSLPARYRRMVEAILREYVPEAEVWAYGSRIQGRSHDGSDLDLVIRSPSLEPLGAELLDLIEAFQESNIPFLVQVHDWAMLPESFHREIEQNYVVVQKPSKQTAMDEWHEVELGGVCTKIGSGATPRGGQGVYLEDGPYALIRSQNIYNAGFAHDGLAFIGDDQAEALSHVEVLPNDVLLNITGDSVARVCQVDPQILPARVNQHVTIVRPDPEKLDPSFLRYYLAAPEVQGTLLSWAGSGGTRNALTKRMIESFVVRAPKALAEQRAIARVLCALDDKIELNRRMNETLEEMARAMFKSWFVDFDPVRAKIEGRWRRGESLPGLPADLYDLFPDRLVDSDLGEIPEGWGVKPLGSFGEIITGKTPSTKRSEYYGEEVPFLRIPDMHGKMYALKTEMMLSAQGVESQSKKTLPPGSVSVSCIATPGLVVLNHRDTQTNQQINSIIPYDQSISKYLYWTCSHLSSDIATGGLGGSVFGNMNKSTFSALLAIHPEPTTVRAFDALVSPIHAAILANEDQANALAAQRDALLPKLVSGEVGVGQTGSQNWRVSK